MHGRGLIELGAIAIVTALGVALAFYSEGYTPFVLALVALTTIVGVGLNILLGLTGQVSLGHVGFYAIGAYAVSILTLNGVNFWIALPLAGALAGLIGALLAVPALRVRGPYLAMVTIAFAFIVQHGIIEWKGLTGGQNGLMNVPAPSLFGHSFTEREMAALAVVLAGLSLWFFHAVGRSGWGKAMLAVRDSEIAARSIGFNPVVVKAAAFALSALLTGFAGGVFAVLLAFVAPDSFPFTDSILFLLSVVVGGAGWTFGPAVGAAIVVGGPQLLSGLAEYKLLFFGALLLIVLWVAPNGVMGALARLLPSRAGPTPRADEDLVADFLRGTEQAPLEVRGLAITFGGIKAVRDVGFTAPPREITSVIGPNGAGKTTVLNMVGGFYRPDTGSIRLSGEELAGAPAWRTARAGIARTYQTTNLFAAMTVIDNVLVGLRQGHLGGLVTRAETGEGSRVAEALLAFVGYRGPTDALAGNLPHVDRRLVEIARALATKPRVLLLDEPAAGLLRAEKDALSKLIRRVADLGLAVVLVEHDMALVMGISDRVVVLDAGAKIADGTPTEVRRNEAVLRAYLGGAEMRARPRRAALAHGQEPPVLAASGLHAGYGAVPVLADVSFDVRPGETVAMLGANGAGKSTTMRALTGLLRASRGTVTLAGERIERIETHRIVAMGLALVPEGRQVFPELSVADNLRLGAFARRPEDEEARVAALLARFPRLRERLAQPAGLLSGGEQQMLAIARALVGNPRVLLMDEPSLGLAPALINDLFDVVAELRDEGVTILLVDQMAVMALSVADRAYVLESGRVVREGTAAELSEVPALEAAYLGHVEAAQ